MPEKYNSESADRLVERMISDKRLAAHLKHISAEDAKTLAAVNRLAERSRRQHENGEDMWENLPV